MEKALQPYDKERMRLAMLKHEEIFKEQVYELHRLYRIQKMLMDNVGLSKEHQQQRQKQERFLVESKKQPFMIIHHQNHHQQQQQQQQQQKQINGDSKSKNNFIGLLQRPHNHHQMGVVRSSSDALEHIAESNSNNNNNNNMVLGENEIELTLSLGPSVQQNPRRPKTDKSESGQSISSSSTGSSQTRKSSPKKSSLTTTTTRGDFIWGPSTTFTTQGSEKERGFSNGQQTNPPWLFQTLSLKLT